MSFIVLREYARECSEKSNKDGCWCKEFDLCAAPRKTEFDNFGGKEETRGLN